MTATFLPESSTRTRPTYIPGLDGLRGLSVLAVIAYHLDLTWATGGYMGVEVFFAVSGFLITRIIIGDHELFGSLDRKRFWVRRARRLLPAIVVLIVAVTAWTTFVLSSDAYRGDAMASLFYVQNWHLIITEAPYFEAFGRPSPLRHLWSLAIEEQFYLLWPIVLPLGIKRLRRRDAVAVLAGAGIASMLWMGAIADVAAPERAYYGTDSRMFSILIGAVAATLTTATWETARQRRRWLDLVAFASVAVLARQLMVRSEFDPWTYPWGFVLVDVCTVLVIAACLQQGSTVDRMLGNRVLRTVGLRSYSLYLWHWPVIAFTQPGDVAFSGTVLMVVRIGFTIVLSELSYRYIELPFRYGRRRSIPSTVGAPARPWWTSGAVLAAVIVLVTAAGLAHATAADTDAQADRDVAVRSDAAITTATTAPADEAAPTTTGPASPRVVNRAPTATMTPPPPPPSVTLVGESVSLGAAPVLAERYGPRILIDAIESRSFENSVLRLEELSAAGQLGEVIVLHLGNNGAVPAGAMDRILNATGDRALVFFTVRVPRRWEGQVNDAIHQTAAAHDRIDIVDWNAVANNEPGLLRDDGVHLTAQGQVRYADLVVAATG